MTRHHRHHGNSQLGHTKMSKALGAWRRCFDNARFLADVAAVDGNVEFQDAVWRLTRFITLVKFLFVEYDKQRAISPGKIGGDNGLAKRTGITRHGVYSRIENAGCTQEMLEDDATTLDDLVRNNPVLRDIVTQIEEYRQTVPSSPKLPQRWPLSTREAAQR